MNKKNEQGQQRSQQADLRRHCCDEIPRQCEVDEPRQQTDLPRHRREIVRHKLQLRERGREADLRRQRAQLADANDKRAKQRQASDLCRDGALERQRLGSAVARQQVVLGG